MDDSSPFDIDPRALDHECVHHARRSRAAGGREADARHAYAQAKAAYDVVLARMVLRIRAAPGSFALRDKPTVDEVEACVRVLPDCIAALTLLNQSKYELDIASADVSAYLDRRKMLERLVDLAAMDWSAEREPRPRTSEGRDAARTAQMKAQVGDGIEINRTKNEE